MEVVVAQKVLVVTHPSNLVMDFHREILFDWVEAEG